MSDPLTMISTRRTPQTEQAEPSQVRNSAGGYVFTIDPIAQLRRFLIMGTGGGTFYVGERELTAENGKLVIDLAKTRGLAVVDEATTISVEGRALRQQPAIFALAVVAGVGFDDDLLGQRIQELRAEQELPDGAYITTEETARLREQVSAEVRRAALDAVTHVCRTGTTLFEFVKYAEQFRGWGRGMRRAIADWYTSRDARSLAYQLAKYQSREGWSHADLLRMSHPKPPGGEHAALFDWVCGRDEQANDSFLPPLVGRIAAAHKPDAKVAALIRGSDLSWEMLPSESLNDPDVWKALLDNGLPLGALLRQLPRLTRIGLCEQLGRSSRVEQIVARLTDPVELGRARIHPMAVLIALKTYASGRSERGSGTWQPSAPVVGALNAAFYAAFPNVVPSGKRVLLAVDVSPSMTHAATGTSLSAREAAAALALVTAATEPRHRVMFFAGSDRYGRGATDALAQLAISPQQRLDDVMRMTDGLSWAHTDCSLPMRFALDHALDVDVFQVVTDNETWSGPVHAHQALRQYRERSGIGDAKLIVQAMTPTRFSIADPSDAGMLDIAGFDAATPALCAAFARGEV